MKSQEKHRLGRSPRFPFEDGTDTKGVDTISLRRDRQIWTQSWSDWPQMGKIRNFKKSKNQNVLKLIFKSPRFVPFFGRSDPIWVNIESPGVAQP